MGFWTVPYAITKEAMHATVDCVVGEDVGSSARVATHSLLELVEKWHKAVEDGKFEREESYLNLATSVPQGRVAHLFELFKGLQQTAGPRSSAADPAAQSLVTGHEGVRGIGNDIV
jgi:hypothetical protein